MSIASRVAPGRARQSPADAGSTRYWAFISYSRDDEPLARSLHGRLERFRIPRTLDVRDNGDIPATSRMRPVFLDDDELPASADLGGQLRGALDHSRSLIVIASPRAAASRWVDTEVEHMVKSGRRDDIVVVVVDGEPNGPPSEEALPPAPRSGPEPVWVDARGTRHSDRRVLVRVAAGVLGVGFDTLWRRDQKARRQRLIAWLLTATIVLTAVGAAFWRQQRLTDIALAEEQRAAAAELDREQQAAAAKLEREQEATRAMEPEQQRAAFERWMDAELERRAQEDDTFPGVDIEPPLYRILVSDNVNDDERLDFIVMNNTQCGSGGCSTEVYMAEEAGTYRQVLNLFGYMNPQVRAADANNGMRNIVATRLWIDDQPVYTVFEWDGREYVESTMMHCRDAKGEYCWMSDPTIIQPVDDVTLELNRRTIVRRSPNRSAQAIEGEFDASTAVVVGRVKGTSWYLVDVWKGVAGFVRDPTAA